MKIQFHHPHSFKGGDGWAELEEESRLQYLFLNSISLIPTSVYTSYVLIHSGFRLGGIARLKGIQNRYIIFSSNFYIGSKFPCHFVQLRGERGGLTLLERTIVLKDLSSPR